MKNLDTLKKEKEKNELLLIVHPFSNRTNKFYNPARNEDYSDFTTIEKSYLDKIKNVVRQDQREAIITQPLWALDDMKEYLKRISPFMKRTILPTHGSLIKEDSPEPIQGWKLLIKLLSEVEQENIVICGAQLGIWGGRFHKDYFGYCVGGTYASLKKGVKNKNITLERELCLIYDYR